MKNQEYIHAEYRKECRYCEHGAFSFDQTAVLCRKRGIMMPDDFCKKYVYDPLKREPMKPKKQTNDFSPEDFSL